MRENGEGIYRWQALFLGFLLALGATGAAWSQGVLKVGPGQTYATIQAAVDAAQASSAILVYPSTYHESVSVTKSGISLVAQGSGVIVDVLQAPGKACFEVKADRVRIHGFDLTGTNMAPGIRFEGSHNHFSGNHIYDLNAPGVNALTCKDPDGGSDFNVIENNRISGADLGIVVGSDSKTAVNRRNTIVGNHIELIGASGIVVYNGIGFLIAGNVVEHISFGVGISISSMGNNNTPQHSHTVTGNTISDTNDFGIGVFADDTGSLSKVVISNNKVSLIGTQGIVFQRDPRAHLAENVVSGNWISEAQDTGILVDDSVNRNRVEFNLVLDGSTYGIQVNGNHNRITSNTVLGNGTRDLDDGGTGNRWKDNAYGTSSWGR